MQNLLIDTDIVIDYLRGYQPAIDYIEKAQQTFFMSTITVAELFAGIRNEKEKIIAESTLSFFHIIPMNYDIALIGGTFREKYGKSHGTSLMDALIAATAHHHQATLVTLNKKHFPMVKILQPYKK